MLRRALRAQNLERNVRFDRNMSHPEVIQAILNTFQAFGHMEDRLVELQ